MSDPDSPEVALTPWHPWTLERIYSRCEPAPGNCLVWQGATVGKGYGKIVVRRRALLVHRVALSIHEGLEDLPDPAIQCRHLCPGRAPDRPGRWTPRAGCVRVEHLAWGGPTDNAADAELIHATTFRMGEHCRSGRHLLADVGLYVHPTKGWRTCKGCRRESNRRAKARRLS